MNDIFLKVMQQRKGRRKNWQVFFGEEIQDIIRIDAVSSEV